MEMSDKCTKSLAYEMQSNSVTLSAFIMPENIVECFQPSGDSPNQFEGMAKENGELYWYARDFMVMLGYDKFQTFENAVQRGIRACTSLGIPLQGVINPIEREIDGAPQRDYKLSRFGCYLVAINGDVRKPEVAAAQAYFLSLAEAFRQYVQKAEAVERVLIRSDISERENSLRGVANTAGVENYAFFQNAGYRGMYDMDLWKIRSIKNIPATRSPLDFMGRQEMAS